MSERKRSVSIFPNFKDSTEGITHRKLSTITIRLRNHSDQPIYYATIYIRYAKGKWDSFWLEEKAVDSDEYWKRAVQPGVQTSRALEPILVKDRDLNNYRVTFMDAAGLYWRFNVETRELRKLKFKRGKYRAISMIFVTSTKRTPKID